MSVLALYPSHHQTSPCQFWEKIFSHTDPDFGNENKDGCQTGIVMKFFSRVSQVQLQLLSNKYLAGKQGEKKALKLGISKDTQISYSGYLPACLSLSIYICFNGIWEQNDNNINMGVKEGKLLAITVDWTFKKSTFLKTAWFDWEPVDDQTTNKKVTQMNRLLDRGRIVYLGYFRGVLLCLCFVS